MTPEFKAKFAELCKAEPEKFQLHENELHYWFSGDWYIFWNEKQRCHSLHKLAEALGGDVVASPNFDDNGFIISWSGIWILKSSGIRSAEFGVSTQELALESAVIGLMEWYLKEKKI